MYTIYKIQKDEKVYYIGKTIDFKRRVYQHRYRKKLDKSYEFIILEDDLSQEEAKKKEEYYIAKYDTFLSGWNRTAGEGTRKVKTKEGDGRFKKGNQAAKGKNLKKVLCVDTGVVYGSVKECARAIDGKEFSVYNVCRGHRKTYKKMHFEYI